MGIFVGIDPDSDGLKRARRMGVSTTASGIEGLMAMPEFDEIEIVFDATSASAHHRHASLLSASGRNVVDLTPAAVGPYVIPSVNGEAYLDEPNVNMVTCGGQATIPIVAAISGVTSAAFTFADTYTDSNRAWILCSVVYPFGFGPVHPLY